MLFAMIFFPLFCAVITLYVFNIYFSRIKGRNTKFAMQLWGPTAVTGNNGLKPYLTPTQSSVDNLLVLAFRRTPGEVNGTNEGAVMPAKKFVEASVFKAFEGKSEAEIPVQCLVWDCDANDPDGQTKSAESVADAMSVPRGENVLSLLAIECGELLDILNVNVEKKDDGIYEGLCDDEKQKMESFIIKFSEYLSNCGGVNNRKKAKQNQKIAEIVNTSAGNTEQKEIKRLKIDAKSILEQGISLMTGKKGSGSQPFYAAKFFKKAYDVLEAVLDEAECNESSIMRSTDVFEKYDPNLCGSAALCLGWLIIAHGVQGPTSDTKDDKSSARREAIMAAAKLRQDPRYIFFAGVPMSIPARALVVDTILMEGFQGYYFLPKDGSKSWSADKYSLKNLEIELKKDPKDQFCRRALILTLFLAGDLERCLTECIKVSKILQDPFGVKARAAIAQFMGSSHPLLEQLSAAGL